MLAVSKQKIGPDPQLRPLSGRTRFESCLWPKVSLLLFPDILSVLFSLK